VGVVLYRSAQFLNVAQVLLVVQAIAPKKYGETWKFSKTSFEGFLRQGCRPSHNELKSSLKAMPVGEVSIHQLAVVRWRWHLNI
jgi:hypothetical protein